jgi:hypothetical protein
MVLEQVQVRCVKFYPQCDPCYTLNTKNLLLHTYKAWWNNLCKLCNLNKNIECSFCLPSPNSSWVWTIWPPECKCNSAITFRISSIWQCTIKLKMIQKLPVPAWVCMPRLRLAAEEYYPNLPDHHHPGHTEPHTCHVIATSIKKLLTGLHTGTPATTPILMVPQTCNSMFLSRMTIVNLSYLKLELPNYIQLYQSVFQVFMVLRSCQKWPHGQIPALNIICHLRMRMMKFGNDEEQSSSHSVPPLSTDDHQRWKV